MKVLHCADLHLDSRMQTHLEPAKARVRKAEILMTYNRMVEYGANNGARAIIIAGDMFDTAHISVNTRNAVVNSIVKHPEITFYYLRGNHDSDSFINEMEEIPENLKLFSEEWSTYETGELLSDSVHIVGIELSDSNKDTAYSDLNLDPHKVNIVVMHGQDAPGPVRDKAEIINLKALRNRGIDYLALGHIHSYKKELLDSRGVYCYPGCLEGRGFDECGKHGFMELDIDETNRSVTSRFVPCAERLLLEVEVIVSGAGDMTDIIELTRKTLAVEDIASKNLIRILLKGEVDYTLEISTELLAEEFRGEYYYVQVKDETVPFVDYDLFALDISLKGEFIRTVMAEPGLTEAERGRIIRYGIKALSREVID